MLKKALALGAEYLATGHYARVNIQERGYCLKKAKDSQKDQSYFLYRLTQDKLKHILFPLGNYTKPQVRELAKEFALPVAEKKESQEICFLPKDDYRFFLQERLPKAQIALGPVVDKQGKALGRHKGVAFYTIGQREGLGIAAGRPVYVVKIDAKKNLITVGSKEEALSKEFLVKDLSFIGGSLKKKVALEVKIRYNHPQSPAEISPFGKKLKVKFKIPQFAITPGQSAVFYAKDKVIGGGIIEEVLC